MKYTNKYKKPDPAPPFADDVGLNIPPEDYDFNFVLGDVIRTLSSEWVDLRPYVPSLYARASYQGCLTAPDFKRVFAVSLDTLPDVLRQHARLQSQPSHLYLAAFMDPSRLKSPPPEWSKVNDPTAAPGREHYVLSGWLLLMARHPDDLEMEFGIGTFPFARGSGVTKQAAAQGLEYTLDLPRDGGLGFRRVIWKAMGLPDGAASIAVARAVGFKDEAVARCAALSGEGIKAHHPGREGDPQWPIQSWDDFVLSTTYVDWEDGLRDRVRRILGR